MAITTGSPAPPENYEAFLAPACAQLIFSKLIRNSG
jgi:hypothetical protein